MSRIVEKGANAVPITRKHVEERPALRLDQNVAVILWSMLAHLDLYAIHKEGKIAAS
jgi:hypothetical protein